MKLFDNIFKTIISLFFGIYVLYLILLTMNSTLISIPHESYMIEDNPLKHLIVCGLVLVCAIIIRRSQKYWKRIECACEHIKKYLTPTFIIVILLFCLWLIVSLQASPHGDQELICLGAEGLADYDFSLFARGNYYDYWPHQSRITTLIWGLFTVFGKGNYLALQVICGASIAAIIYLIAKIWTETSSMESGYVFKYMLITCAFLPIFYFSTYIYGNIPGLALVLYGCLSLIRYLKTHKFSYVVLTSIAIAAGIVVKNTYQIVLAAVVIMLIVDALRIFLQDKKIAMKSLLAALIVFLATSAAGRCVDYITESRLTFEISEGTPLLAWITMAFAEDENNNPVRYNAYNLYVYTDNDCDSKKADAVIKEDLKANLANITDTSDHFLNFMGRKMEWCWADPTYDCIVEVNKGKVQNNRNGIIKWIIRCSGDNAILRYSNLLQTVTLVGSFFWIILKRKQINTMELIFPLIFVGGFTFQLFWESLALYGLQYMLLLMPIAYDGYMAMADICIDTYTKGRVAGLSRQTLVSLVVGVISLMLICFVSFFNVPHINQLIKPTYDQEIYEQRMNEIRGNELRQIPAIKDGIYLLKNAADQYEISITVHTEYEKSIIRYFDDGLVLSRESDDNDNITIVKDSDDFLWDIAQDENGYFEISNAGLSLESQNGELVLQPSSGEISQRWLFERR